MRDVAEGVLVLMQEAIRRQVDAPGGHILAIMVARGQPQCLRHAGRRRVVVISGCVGEADPHEGRGWSKSGYVLAQAGAEWRPLAHTRNCSVILAPKRLFSVMNSLMNSCNPRWKMPSMRLF